MKKPRLEIARTLVCSTAHITNMDRLRLEQGTTGQGPIFYPKEDYGWWVNIPLGEAEDGVVRRARKSGYSVHFARLMRLMRLAYQHKCSWLMLDSDGPYIDDMRRFSW